MQQLLIGFVAFSLLSSSTLDWWQIVLMCMGGAGSVIYALYTYQENLLFQPVIMNFHSPEQNPPGYRSPAERKMAFEEVNFDAEDGEKLTGWFIPAKEVSDVEQGEAVTILYFHANAGNMGFRLPFLEKLHHFTPCNVFIISYRGYGRSSGKPSEEGIYMDADAALKHLKGSGKVHPDRIIVFGRSLGGAVSINIVSRKQDQVRGMILENTFTSISDMADKIFPILQPIKSYILRMNFSSIDLIGTIEVPILYISGLQDEVVPPSHMQDLWDASTKAKRVVILRVPDGMHNDTWMKAEELFFKMFRKFVQETIPEAPSFDEAYLESAEKLAEQFRAAEAGTTSRSSGVTATNGPSM
ncbi:hypothetical protein AAMO2058_001211400 [Amorphochlora amoebiformis]|mmetsp:Transcript_7028/g.10878  ORF Transcript_7028/g.10878 Transcript_7028/m.10878 type:complete len:356 (-) Transcript_7028:42-1109(-)